MADTPAVDTFGRLLRSRRHAADLTQDELAALSGVGQASISAYENGNLEPSFINAVALAHTLKITVDELAEAGQLQARLASRRRRLQPVAS